VTLWGALAGGFVGALVVVLGSDGAAWARVTRFDIPLLLGSGVFARREAARAAGYGLHLLLGLAFSAAYASAGAIGWGVGALAGLVHGIVAVGVLFPVVLPVVHRRMALRGDRERAIVEAPGLLTIAYGRWTPVLLIALHVAYGTLVGGFAAWGSG
jgi:hypothetical protein